MPERCTKSDLNSNRKKSEIDQQKAPSGWAKLQEETQYVDQVLVHPQHVFCCIFNGRDTKVSTAHYDIGIFPSNSDPANDDPVADIVLVQEKNGNFSVIQDSVDTGRTTPLTTIEVNSLLEQIANSTRKTDGKNGETEDVISQTREKLQ